MPKSSKVLVTGGAGYVGAPLCRELIRRGHQVRSLDIMYFGEEVFDDELMRSPNFESFKGDIRDLKILEHALQDVENIVHLACISNDPSFDLNPRLGRSINLDSFEPLVRLARKKGVHKFINASSSSVYGVSQKEKVDEATERRPLTDYSKFKAMCEDILSTYTDREFQTLSIRPATLCGYSRRQRLDTIINILTNHAYHKRRIIVHGGEQYRPNLHIDDMVNLYSELIEKDWSASNGKAYNAGYSNMKVIELAEMVRDVVGADVTIAVEDSIDQRSYRIDSERIKSELGVSFHKDLRLAVRELTQSFERGLLRDTFNDGRFFNIKRLKDLGLGS